MSRPSLSGAVSAEFLKLRGTLAAWMCLIAPALVVAVYVLQMNFVQLGNKPPPAPGQAWALYAQSVLVLWAFLMLPLFVTLQAALLAALEHGNQQWKHLLALAVPRRHHFLAKAFALAAMLLAASAALVLLMPIGGWLLMHTRPQLGIAGPPPWDFLLSRGAAIFAAAMLMAAIQLWIALRWRSFTIAVGVGMGATVAGYLIGQSKQFGHLYPWSMPLHTLASDGSRMHSVLVVGLIGAAAIGALALWDFLRREHP
ncbi:MAG TPA: ABC transporter permease [Luteimonas sp.]|nr:ABC transporter permease [Luteimonas sp.]